MPSFLSRHELDLVVGGDLLMRHRGVAHNGVIFRSHEESAKFDLLDVLWRYMVVGEYFVGGGQSQDSGRCSRMKLIQVLSLQDFLDFNQPYLLPVFHLLVFGDCFVDVPFHEELLVNRFHVTDHLSHIERRSEGHQSLHTWPNLFHGIAQEVIATEARPHQIDGGVRVVLLNYIQCRIEFGVLNAHKRNGTGHLSVDPSAVQACALVSLGNCFLSQGAYIIFLASPCQAVHNKEDRRSRCRVEAGTPIEGNVSAVLEEDLLPLEVALVARFGEVVDRLKERMSQKGRGFKLEVVNRRRSLLEGLSFGEKLDKISDVGSLHGNMSKTITDNNTLPPTQFKCTSDMLYFCLREKIICIDSEVQISLKSSTQNLFGFENTFWGCRQFKIKQLQIY